VIPPYVALFMVPGIGHCAGGFTPTKFDTFSALQDWTERGLLPHQIIAVTEDDSEYSMPLMHRNFSDVIVFLVIGGVLLVLLPAKREAVAPGVA
jgi:Tannase and feruloyl esterase